MILIDADILIDLFRHYPPATAWVASVYDEHLCIPGFVAMQLIQGCHDRRDLVATERWLGRYRILWPDETHLERAPSRFGIAHLRFGIDAFDALIAETAIGANLPLHTFNARHFAAYPQLVTIQPYTKAQP